MLPRSTQTRRLLLTVCAGATVVGCKKDPIPPPLDDTLSVDTDPVDPTETDTDTDADTDTDECSSRISGDPFPTSQGTTPSWPTMAVAFGQDETGTAAFTLVRASNQQPVSLEPLSVSPDGRFAFTQPIAPLRPNTDYVWTIRYSCGGSRDVRFTTGPTGPAVSPDSLLDRNYRIELDSPIFLEPPGMGPLFDSLVGGQEFSPYVVRVIETLSTPASIGLIGGFVGDTGSSLQQDVCEVTDDLTDAPAVFQPSPYFDIEVQGVLSTGGADLYEVRVSGAFTPDLGTIEGITMSGTMDTRPLDSLVPSGSEDTTCDLIVAFTNGAVSCRNCPPATGITGRHCLPLRITNLSATEVTGSFSLVERNADIIWADPGTCPDGPFPSECDGCDSAAAPGRSGALLMGILGLLGLRRRSRRAA